MSHPILIHRPKPEAEVLDNLVRVSTPENISFQYEVVGPMRRLIAYGMDILLVLVGYGILVFVSLVVFRLLDVVGAGTVVGPLLDLLSSLATALILVGAFLSMWFYGAWMEANFNGQTLGKRTANIRVLSDDGSSLDGTQATLRNFFRLLDLAPFLPLSMLAGPDAGSLGIPLFGFGLLSMMLSRKYQRLGDIVAGTMVVNESRKWVHGLARFSDPRVAELAQLIPENYVITPSMARALAEYVDRRRVLAPRQAREIAAYIGRLLIDRLGLEKDTDHDLLLCSLYYRTFVGDTGSNDNPFLNRLNGIDVSAASNRPKDLTPQGVADENR